MEKRIFKPEMLLIIALPIVLSLLGRTSGQSPTPNGIGQNEIYLATGILTGILAFFVYLRWTTLALISTVVIPLVFSLLIVTLTPEPVSLTTLYPPLLIFAGLLYTGLRHIFYLPSLLRFRTIVFALFGAISMAVYFRLQYAMMKVSPEPGFWMNRFVNSFLLFIIVTVAISIADMIITNKEIRKLREERRRAILNDEIDDEDDDVS